MGTRLAPARKAALAILGDVRRHQAHARDVLRSSARLNKLTPQDIALVERLVLGVTATSGTLDKLYGAYLSKKSRLEPRVCDALRLATFELSYLATPQAVAVSQGVELVRSVAPQAAGLANAILRKVGSIEVPRIAQARQNLSDIYQSEKNKQENGQKSGQKPGSAGDSSHSCANSSVNSSASSEGAPEVTPEVATETIEALALIAGWPTWLTCSLLQSLGFIATYEMALCALDAAPVWISGNVALHTADQTQGLLCSIGLEPQTTSVPDVFQLSSVAGLGSSGLVSSGDLVVSDFAARLVALLASPRPGSRVLEIGQGRGTKTLLLEAAACKQGGPAYIVGVDNSAFKVRVAQKHLCDWQPYVTSIEADARCLSEAVAGLGTPEEETGRFDEVFVDAPCSGTGTMRRHPEITWSLSEDALDPVSAESLPALQLAILRAAATRVREGGTLVYSTCSVLKQECADVVRAFLAEQSESFALIPADQVAAQLSDDVRSEIVRYVRPDGMFASSPVSEGPDGHFCAVFKRVAR